MLMKLLEVFFNFLKGFVNPKKDITNSSFQILFHLSLPKYFFQRTRFVVFYLSSHYIMPSDASRYFPSPVRLFEFSFDLYGPYWSKENSNKKVTGDEKYLGQYSLKLNLVQYAKSSDEMTQWFHGLS